MNTQNAGSGELVAQLSELEDRIPHPVDVKGEEIALILMDEKVYAINNICTHEYACLSDGYVEDDRIVCPLHLAEFDITTGEVVEDPAEEDLQTYEVTVLDDDIYVDI